MAVGYILHATDKHFIRQNVSYNGIHNLYNYFSAGAMISNTAASVIGKHNQKESKLWQY
jgi:hypothetical protein